MTPNNVPYLCGGTLFSLILQARKQRTKARDKYKGGSDGLKDTDVMIGLLYVVTGSRTSDFQGSTFSKCTTQFKTCLNYGTTYIPFTEPSVVSSYTNWLNKKDPDLLRRMSEFIDTYIDKGRVEWLVKALLETIAKDISIDDNTEFSFTMNSEIMRKDFDSVNKVELPIFLLSVLGYILSKPTSNQLGRATFEKWHTQKGSRSPWKFISNIGTSNKYDITVSIESSIPENEQNSEDVSSTVSKTSHDVIVEKMSESALAIATTWENDIDNLAHAINSDTNNQCEFEEESDSIKEDTETTNSTTIIQHQTNVEQKGEKNINITNNGTMNIKL